MGKLVQVATSTVSSPVSSVTLTGIDSDDVYMLAVLGATTSSTSATHISLRVTVSGVADSGSNYSQAQKNLRTDTTFTNEANQNITLVPIINQMTSTATQSQGNSIVYLYNLYNSSEYSFGTNESVDFRYNQVLYGRQGGWVNTQLQSCDGVQIFSETASTNLTAGTYTLYKVL